MTRNDLQPDPGSPTWLFVGGFIAAALLTFFWLVLDTPYAAGATVALLYEGWTFRNKWKRDTISEVVWALSKRPLVPFIFGAGAVAMIAHGIIKPTVEGLYVALSIGFLFGHFFFQRNGD